MANTTQHTLEVGSEIMGVAHDRNGDLCKCGCAFTANLKGVVIEAHPDLDLLVAAFLVPNPAGGPHSVHKTAFSFGEVS